MNENIKAYKRSQYTISAIIILLGVALSLFSWLLIDMIGLVFAVSFIIFGSSLACKCVLANKHENVPGIKFISSLVIIFMGIFCFFNPSSIIHFAVSITGFSVLAVALNNIFRFVKFKNNKNYLSFEFIKYCINLVFGLLLLLSPVITFEFLMIIFGVYLIYFGITFAIEVHSSEIYLG